MSPNKFVVHIIETATGEKSWSSTPADEDGAQRIEMGLQINLNHDKFHTEIEELE